MRSIKKIGTGALAFVTAFSAAASMLPADVFAAEEDFRGQLSSVTAAQAQGNIVNIEFNNGDVKAKITFLENDIFRYNVDPTGQFEKYATPRSADHMGRIQAYPDESDHYSHPSADVKDNGDSYTITSGNTTIIFDKDTALMTVKNGDNVVMEEKEPLTISDSSTVQTLVKKESEDFFGGGTQNGRFVHTGETVNIVNESTWTDGGVSSPNPFYYTTGGYGVLRNTFSNGWYDFGDTTADAVVTKHQEAELDAYYFVSDASDKTGTVQQLLQDYYTVTGNPVLLPEYGFYLGHLNNYNRDSWDTTSTEGAQKWIIKGNADSDSKEGTITYESGRAAGYILEDGQHAESLNGSGPSVAREKFPQGVDTPLEYSARNVLDTYQMYDMPLGYFVPNDGYGGGYGQNGYYQTGGVNSDGTSSEERLAAVAANVQNLAEFTKYANGKGVATGLWTQSYLTPDSNADTPWHLLRDFENEVKIGGITTLKTDVAWVGPGYSMQLDGVKKAYDIVTTGVEMRPNIVSLDGWAGSQRYNSVWTGDQSGGQWEYIRFHIPTYIGQSLSGNPNVGSDMDGIFGGAPIISARDYQWKSMTPQMLDMDGWGSYVKAPYTHGDPYTGISRMYLKLKAQMMPYTYTNAYAAANMDTGNGDTGLPMIRAMFLEFPNDSYAASKAMQYQFMYGSSLLVAPVYQDTAADENGNDIRNNIYLPDEDTIWIDYFTGQQYKGGQAINGYDAPLWKLPLFVKNGAIIPMYEENNTIENVDKSNRIVEFWPAGSTEYTVIEDDGSTMTNQTEEDSEYGTIDNISYGGHVSTRLTSVVEGDTATLTAEKSTGTYSGYDKNKNTEFTVNVSKEPDSILAKNGNTELEVVKVDSLEAFEQTAAEAGKAVYFYDASPEIQTYASAEEVKLQQMVENVTVSPKLHVKFAETDAQANAQTLVINGFANEGTFEKDQLNENLPVPVLTAAEEDKTPSSIRLTWNPVADATSYEIMVDGIVNGVGDKTVFDHVDLDYNSTHVYKVRARNAEGYSNWSEELTTSSLDDPWRNVPDVTVSWDGGDQWGAIGNATDHNLSTIFHSTNGDVVSQGTPLIMDLGQGYLLDEFRYYPRGEGQSGDGNVGVNSNGTVQQMDVYVSLDGVNWKQMQVGAENPWSYNQGASVEDSYKTVELGGTPARYVKLVVTKSVGGFFAANELVVYKTDGSLPFAVGTIAQQGRTEVTDTDYQNLISYTGISSSEPAFATQVSGYGLDINYNNVYDIYDYAYTMFQLDGGTRKSGSVSGNALLLASTSSLKAGQMVTVDIYADNIKNLNAFGQVLNYDSSQLEYVKIEQGAGVLGMTDLSINKSCDDRSYVNVAYANRGDKALYNGSGILATITMKAKTDIGNLTDIMSLGQMTLIGPDYSVVMSDAASNPVIPGIPGEVTTKYGQDDFTITMTNDVLDTDDGTNVSKITQNGTYDPLFNGEIDRVFEFKWAMAGSADDKENLLPDYVKLPTTMHFAFHEASPLTNFIVHDANPSGNGRLTSAEAVVTFEDDTSTTIPLSDQQSQYNFEVNSGGQTRNADKKVKTVDITFLSATGSATYDTPQENRMLSLGEIEFFYTKSVSIDSIDAAEDNVKEMYVGYLSDVNAVILPEDAPNKFFTVESSNPEVASIITLADENKYPVYKVRGMSEGKATITLTSAADKTKTTSYEIVVKEGADKTQLQALYNQYKNITGDIYTQESYGNLLQKLDNAYKILENMDATRSEVDKAAVELEDAYNALEIIPADEGKELPASVVTDITALYSESNLPSNLFDGNLETYWESPYSGNDAKLPQDVIITLDNEYMLEQLTFISHTIQNGGVTQYEISVSTDGQMWTKATSGNIDANDYKQGKNVTVNARFAATPAKYVKFTVLGAVGRVSSEDNIYARVADMKLFGAQPVDKSGLQTRYDELKDLVQGNYTDVSWAEFVIARTEALNVLNDPNATESDVAAALANLNAKYGLLQEKPSDPAGSDPGQNTGSSGNGAGGGQAGTGSSSDQGNAVDTGDTTNPGILFLLLGVAISAVAITVRLRKKG